jgi:hypothetical protein
VANKVLRVMMNEDKKLSMKLAAELDSARTTTTTTSMDEADATFLRVLQVMTQINTSKKILVSCLVLSVGQFNTALTGPSPYAKVFPKSLITICQHAAPLHLSMTQGMLRGSVPKEASQLQGPHLRAFNRICNQVFQLCLPVI